MEMFTGKTAVVTGASRGIGREIAKALALEGARVVVVARTENGLQQTQAEIEANGGTAWVLPADLRSEESINKLAQEVLTRWSPVDFVVNNAAAWHNADRAYYGPHLDSTPPDEINEVLDVGLRAPVLLTRLFLPAMIARRDGKILNISGGFSGVADAVGWVHCYISKKGIEHFTEGLAEELRPHEIQVNCISPWYVATEPVMEYMSDDLENALDPHEVAKLAVFLLSKEADHLTGQIILIRNKLDPGEAA